MASCNSSYQGITDMILWKGSCMMSRQGYAMMSALLMVKGLPHGSSNAIHNSMQ